MDMSTASAARLRSEPGKIALAVLAVCSLLILSGRGLLEAYAVFLLPLVQEFGWGRTAASGVYAVSFAVLGWSGPVIGWLFDRWGPARLYLLGIACVTAGVMIVVFADRLWHFYLGLGLLAGFGAACLGAVPTAALLSRWFRRRLNSAMAVAYAAGGLGILALAPTAQYLIDLLGWRHAYLVFAGAFAALLPVALLVHWLRAGEGHPDYRFVDRPDQTPGKAAPGEGITVRQAFRMPAFWGFGWVFCFTGIGMYTVMLQTPAFLVEIGYDPAFAAQAFGLCGLLAPAGMIGFGWLGDRIGRRRAILLSYALTLTGIGFLWGLSVERSLWLLAGFIICFGGTFGSRGPAISTIAAQIFRGPHLGGIYGFVAIGAGLGGGLGAYSGGFWHDLTGDYQAGFAFALVMVTMGSLPFLVVRAMKAG